MTITELSMLLKALKGLFPEVTAEQAALIAETARGMHYNRALAVLKTHARQHDFFSTKGLTEALNGDHKKAELIRTKSAEQRIIDWLRYHDRETQNYLAFVNPKAGDLELLREHFQRATAEVERKCEDEHGRAEVARMIRGHAKLALKQIGFADVEASELAAEWSGKKPECATVVGAA
jgi:hypothetical protein